MANDPEQPGRNSRVADSGQVERRKQPRFVVDVPVRLTAEGATFPGHLRDICRDAAWVEAERGCAMGVDVALAVELPVSTVLILRSVADIAQSHGEDLRQVEARLACLEVFAIGGADASQDDDPTQVGYFVVRAALNKQVADASKYVLKHGASNTAAPPLVRFIAMISKRFGIVVTEKLAAQAIPVVGAVGGALINSFFIDHYQNLARAHFTIRQLERKYGGAAIQEAYQKLPPA